MFQSTTPVDKDLQANLLTLDATEMEESRGATHNMVDGVSAAATGASPRLVHESRAYVTPYFPFLLGFPYLLALLSVWINWVTYENLLAHGYPPNAVANVRRLLLFCVLMLFFMSVMLLVIPFVLLPRRFRLYSDARLVVYTTVTSFTFTDLRTAIRNSSYCDTVKRKRWDFATDVRHRVFIKRDPHRWEIMCSPADPDTFVEAVDEACGGGGGTGRV
jgi:hypothetical protein